MDNGTEKISYRKIEKFSNDLHKIANSIKNDLEKIKAVGDKVSGSDCWEGKASNYFLKKFNGITKSFEVLYKELEYSVLFLASCSEGYQAVDKEVMKDICNNLNIDTPSLNGSNVYGNYRRR